MKNKKTNFGKSVFGRGMALLLALSMAFAQPAAVMAVITRSKTIVSVFFS